MRTAPANRFVALEGLDGAGTTTLAGCLAEALQAADLRVLRTAEPSEGPLGAVLRDHVRGVLALPPLAAALAFTADRADHLDRTIRPALSSGAWVVCDRYVLSTMAYQGADGVDPRRILQWSAGFEVPALTVFLDVPADERARRMSSRATRDRYEAAELQERLHSYHLSCIELLRGSGHRVEVLDGTRPVGELVRAVLGRLDIAARDP